MSLVITVTCNVIMFEQNKDRFERSKKGKKEATYMVCISFSNDLLYCFLITHIILLKGEFKFFLCDVPMKLEVTRTKPVKSTSKAIMLHTCKI